MTRFNAQSKIFRLIVLSDDVEQDLQTFFSAQVLFGSTEDRANRTKWACGDMFRIL